MQQLTYLGPRQFEWQEVAKPTLSTGKSALVRPIAVARCDLDYYIALGAYRTPGPFAFGHEMTAVVEDIGDQVTSVRPGDRVIVSFQISCGECTNCQRGWSNACSSVPPLAAYGLGTHPDGDFGGAFSDCVHVPYADAMLVHLPDTLSAAAGAGLSDNVADGFRCVAPLLKEYPREPVLVVGGLAQSVGLYAVHAAVALGSSDVVYVDNDKTRLEYAKKAGASTLNVANYADGLRHERDFLIAVDAAASAEGMRYALRSTAACGFCTSVSGGLSETTELPLASAYLRGVTHEVSRVHGRANLSDTVHQACCGAIDPLALVDKVLSFDDCIDAMLDPSPKLVFERD